MKKKNYMSEPARFKWAAPFRENEPARQVSQLALNPPLALVI